MPEHWSYRCPICDRRFMDELTRRQHLLHSKRCNVVEECLRLQFLLADREEALAVARRQRDEARAGVIEADRIIAKHCFENWTPPS